MTDLQATLDAIDELAVQQCGHCARPLAEDGQSLDFCGDYCQQAWIAGRNEIVELIGYREPWDVPAYQGNLVELFSSEVTPTRPEHRSYGDLTFTITADTAQFQVALEDIRQVQARVLEGFARLWEDVRVREMVWSRWSPQGQEARYFSLRTPTTEPAPTPEGEPFDPDYEYDWRPVPHLHDEEPPLPVMAAPDVDWQARIDASRPQVTFAPSADPARRLTNRRTR